MIEFATSRKERTPIHREVAGVIGGTAVAGVALYLGFHDSGNQAVPGPNFAETSLITAGIIVASLTGREARNKRKQDLRIDDLDLAHNLAIIQDEIESDPANSSVRRAASRFESSVIERVINRSEKKQIDAATERIDAMVDAAHLYYIHDGGYNSSVAE